MADELRHSIKVVARRTGLSPHVIRAWEKRYSTIQPERNDGNRRLYTTADIERLVLLKGATEAGHSIGDIAGLPTDRLAVLLAEEGKSGGAVPRPGPAAPAGGGGSRGGKMPVDLVEDAYAAVEAMDSGELERVLEAGVVELGQVRLLSEVVVPLVERIGEGWRAGRLKVSHEHVASACLRTFLGQVARPIAVHPSAPVLLVTTPAGQLHELGAVLVAAAATNHGWRVMYAGVSLPAEEIVSVARSHSVRAVALSVVHPEDDESLPDEFRRLRRLLPETVAIVVGGRASGAYAGVLGEVGALRASSLGNLTEILDALRRSGRGRVS